jgi:DNA-binding CsgD family transcriptional regulator
LFILQSFGHRDLPPQSASLPRRAVFAVHGRAGGKQVGLHPMVTAKLLAHVEVMKKKLSPAGAGGETRLGRAEARAEWADARTEQAKARAEAAEVRTEQAKTRAEAAETRTEQAETRTDLAKTRTEQAECRTEQAETTLQNMIHKVVEMPREIYPQPLKRVFADGPAPWNVPLQKLTLRQRETLQLIAEGQNTKQIAGILKVSPKTVEYHRLKLMAGLNLHDIPGLVRFAMRAGLISSEKPAVG